MAIALDTTVAGGDGTYSWSHTCTGSHLKLIVYFVDRFNAVTGVTYNGVSMTQFQSQVLGGIGTLYGFYLDNPATGANTVAVSSTHIVGGGISESLTGCTTGIDSSNVGTANNHSLTVSTTVVAANSWLLGCGCGENNVGTNETTNRTQRQSFQFFSNNYSIAAGDSNGTVATGSQSMIFTYGASDAVQHSGIVLSVAPFIPVNNNAMLSFF